MYDAFISYRHTEPDKFVAENLHKKLEDFRLPGSIIKQRGKGCKKRIERVFRDKDELPLTSNLADPITQALEASEFLIVICSPRLPRSQWCKKEIETFISMHGREKVLAVLIEGEPEEAFPEELLYRERVITKEDGSTEKVREAVEPLAADVRGKNRKEILKAMDEELLRLAAAMFDCGYDDLKQRHREQKLRRLLTASLAASSIFLLFGAISTAMAVHIRMQKEQIEQQKVQIEVQYQEALKNQSRSLAEKSLGILSDGDRLSAIRTILTAFEDTAEGTPMPVTPEAEYALTECSYVYQNGEKMMPYQNFAHDTNVLSMQTSPNGKYLLSVDRSGGVYVWEAADGGLRYRVQTASFENQYESECRFLTSERIAYAKDGGLEVYDLEKAEVVFRLEKDYHMVVPNADGQKIAVGVNDMVNSGTLTVYDTQNFQEQVTYTFEEKCGSGEAVAFDEEGGRLIFVKEAGLFAEKQGTSLLVMNLENGEVTAEYPLKYSEVEALKMDGNCLYVCVNQTMDDKFPDKKYDYTVSYNSQILKINLDTGKAEWQFEVSGDWISDCILTTDESSEHILAVYYSDACLLNKETGEPEESYAFGGEVVNAFPLDAPDCYGLMTRNGEFHNIHGASLMDYSYGDYFALGAANLCDFEMIDIGYALLSYDSKNIVYYTKFLGTEGREAWQTDANMEDAFANAQGTRVLLMTYPGAEETQILLTDPESEEIISELKFNGYQAYMGFVGDGSEYFYAGDSEGDVILYRVEDGSRYKVYHKPEYFNYNEVTASADGNHVIFEDYARFFILDLESGKWEELDTEEADDTYGANGKKAMGSLLSLYARTDTAENAVQILERGKEEVLQQIPVPVTYIDNLFFMAGDTELFVQYLDGSVQIFSIETGEMTAELDAFETRIKRVQSLAEGYAFIGERAGYLVNRNMEVTARIPGCRAVIPQRNELISFGNRSVYLFPVYTTEGLVEVAQKIWDSYQE